MEGGEEGLGEKIGLGEGLGVETNCAYGERGFEGEGRGKGCKIGGGKGELGEVEEIGKSSG